MILRVAMALVVAAAMGTACRDAAERSLPALQAAPPPAAPPAGEPSAPPPSEPSAPPIPTEVRAIGPFTNLPPDAARAFDPTHDAEPRPTPGPNDWLANQPEPGQSYAQYRKAAANRPDDVRRVLYLQPLGPLSRDVPSLRDLAAVVHAFFQLEVRVLPELDLAAAAATSRINRHTDRPQLLAPDLLRYLGQHVPPDAYALMAVTMTDLYPDPDWNFVYGQATLVDRVGIQSFARYDPAFFGEPRPRAWKRTLARRSAQVLVHEITHMFGVQHCIYWSCVIAGVNNQEEADAHPLHLCPVDLRKLWWAIGFDLAAREDDLAAAWHRLGQDDEAAWSRQRAAWIRTGVTPAAGHAP